MRTVLIINRDEVEGQNLAQRLRGRHYVVAAEGGCCDASALLHHNSISADIVVLDLSRIDDAALRLVRHVCQLRRSDGGPVLVLAYSRIDRGPQFKLEIERMGARFVYARRV